MPTSLTLLLLIAGLSVCCASENPPVRRRDVTQRSNRSAYYQQQPHHDFVSQMYDRFSTVVNMNQEQRNKLEAIESKLHQLDATTNARFETVLQHQLDASKQIDDLEKVALNVQNTVGGIRNELDMVRYNLDHSSDDATPSPARSSASSANDTDLFVRLDALATFLLSTRAAVDRIEGTLAGYGESLTKLIQLQRGTQKRLSTFPNRQVHAASSFGVHSSHTPPLPIPYNVEAPSCSQAALLETGIQKIQVTPYGEPFYALCEPISEGGWTVIQNRFDGSINFHRDWEEYKNGFGNLGGEFFIGLEKLHAMTSTTLHEIIFVLVDFENATRTAKYGAFAIGGEKESYALHILGDYTGDAGDSFSYQAGNKFSTLDVDNDGWVEGNCAQAHTGAWWYAACEMSNLNGQYLNGELEPEHQFQGMYWDKFHGSLYSLKSVQIKIRPIENRDAD